MAASYQNTTYKYSETFVYGVTTFHLSSRKLRVVVTPCDPICSLVQGTNFYSKFYPRNGLLFSIKSNRR